MIGREPYETCDSIQRSRIEPGILRALNGKMEAPSHHDPFQYSDMDSQGKGSSLQYATWKGGKEHRTGREVEKPNDDWLAAKDTVLAVLKSVTYIDPNDVKSTLFLLEILTLAKVML